MVDQVGMRNSLSVGRSVWRRMGAGGMGGRPTVGRSAGPRGRSVGAELWRIGGPGAVADRSGAV